MEREAFMLAAMSSASVAGQVNVALPSWLLRFRNQEKDHDNIQATTVVLDENVAKQISGSYFDFQPYDYGPYDKDVYIELNQLEKERLVEIITPTVQGVRSFRLTNEGQQAGNEVLGEFPEPIQQYIRDVVNFVRSLSFAELVSGREGKTWATGRQ